MVICLCHGIREREVRDAVDDGAKNIRDVMRHCGAGGTCGSCIPDIREILSERHCGESSGLPCRRTVDHPGRNGPADGFASQESAAGG